METIFKRRRRALAHFDFDETLIKLAFAELRAKFFACAVGSFVGDTLRSAFRSVATDCFRRRNRHGGADFDRNSRRRGRKQKIKQALLGGLLGALGDLIQFFLAHHLDGGFHQIAHHGLDIAADVADLGVAGSPPRAQKGSKRQGVPRRRAISVLPTRPVEPDHRRNIFRHHLFSHFGRELLTAHAIAQGDGYGTLGGSLSDDVLIQLDYDFARSELVK